MQSNPPPYSASTPAPGYGTQPHVAHGTTVIHANVVPTVVPVVVGQQMGTKPSTTTCRSCNLQIVTKVVTRSTLRTHLFAALLCIFGCWPCVFIPYCMDSCNNAEHYCPNCNAYIGSYVN